MSAEIVDFFYECGWCGNPVDGDVFLCSNDCEQEYAWDQDEWDDYEYNEEDGGYYGEDL